MLLKSVQIIVFILAILIAHSLSALSIARAEAPLSADILHSQNSQITQDSTVNSNGLRTEGMREKKWFSALSAFPFPFGFIGAHRVMLGTKPWVPVVYVATLGGCFGLLPLVDFCVIVFSRDIAPYENNPNIFMWLK